LRRFAERCLQTFGTHKHRKNKGLPNVPNVAERFRNPHIYACAHARTHAEPPYKRSAGSATFGRNESETTFPMDGRQQNAQAEIDPPSTGIRRREREIQVAARQAIKELGPDTTLADVERLTCERLGLDFGGTLVWTIHEWAEARRREERPRPNGS
jgi:hypothetical protein